MQFIKRGIHVKGVAYLKGLSTMHKLHTMREGDMKSEIAVSAPRENLIKIVGSVQFYLTHRIAALRPPAEQYYWK